MAVRTTFEIDRGFPNNPAIRISYYLLVFWKNRKTSKKISRMENFSKIASKVGVTLLEKHSIVCLPAPFPSFFTTLFLIVLLLLYSHSVNSCWLLQVRHRKITYFRPVLLSYKKQSFDLQYKSNDWFLWNTKMSWYGF